MDCEVGMFQQLDCVAVLVARRMNVGRTTHIDRLGFIRDLLQITAVSLTHAASGDTDTAALPALRPNLDSLSEILEPNRNW